MAVFDEQGIRFLYPDDWQITEEEGDGLSVAVESPDGALWTVSVYDLEVSTEEMSQAVVEALQSEYADLEKEPAQEFVSGFSLTGYNINFVYLDLTNSAWIRAFQTPSSSIVVYYQAEDRDLPQILPVFRAMLESVLLGLEDPDSPASGLPPV